MSTQIAAITNVKTGAISEAVYEHPFIVRLCHWVNAVALLVLVFSGLQIFRAFPSFGAKIPQKDLLHWPKAYALGGWLGGGLQWHFAVMWAILAFLFGHLVMVVLHGWNNFVSMLTGWKKDPEYL